MQPLYCFRVRLADGLTFMQMSQHKFVKGHLSKAWHDGRLS